MAEMNRVECPAENANPLAPRHASFSTRPRRQTQRICFSSVRTLAILRHSHEDFDPDGRCVARNSKEIDGRNRLLNWQGLRDYRTKAFSLEAFPLQARRAVAGVLGGAGATPVAEDDRPVRQWRGLAGISPDGPG